METLQSNILALVETLKHACAATETGRDEQLRQCRFAMGAGFAQEHLTDVMVQHCLWFPFFKALNKDFLKQMPIAADFQQLCKGLKFDNPLSDYFDGLLQEIKKISDKKTQQKALWEPIHGFYRLYYGNNKNQDPEAQTQDYIGFAVRQADFLLKEKGISVSDKSSTVLDISGDFALSNHHHKNKVVPHSTWLLLHYLFGAYKTECVWANMPECGAQHQLIGEQDSLFGSNLSANGALLQTHNNGHFTMIWANLCVPLLPEEWNKKSFFISSDTALREACIENSQTTHKSKTAESALRYFYWAIERHKSADIAVLLTPISFLTQPNKDGLRDALNKKVAHTYVIEMGDRAMWFLKC